MKRNKGFVWEIIKFAFFVFIAMAVFYLMYKNSVGFKEVLIWGFIKFRAFVISVVG